MWIKSRFYKGLRLGLTGITSCISVFLITNPTLAQQSNITPDNMGAESSRLNRNVIINGINADTIDGGARRDINLFHSFSEFNINNGQAVYFINPDGVKNILTRVTGGNASNIFGTLGVDGAANLFLINPNGIVFGENASLDLQGSFVGTTASGLQFGDKGNFSATNPEIPGNLIVNPSALFFNQVQANGGIINKSQAPAGINPNDYETTGLRVPDGKNLLLVGGEIKLDGGRLRAYEGNIELASLAAPGTVGLKISGDTFSLNIPEDMERGDISLANISVISVFGAGGGNFTINARNLEISNSFIFAGIAQNSDNPNAQAGDINLNATGLIEVKNASTIFNDVDSFGNAGDININANSLLIAEDSSISNDTFGIGNAGNININANSLSLTEGSAISNDIFGIGNAGNININARDTVSFDNISSVSSNVFSSGLFDNISSNVYSDGVGKGGDIRIKTGNLSLTNGSDISTNTLGEGNAGNIFVEASDSVKLDGVFRNPNISESSDNLLDGIIISSGIRSDSLMSGMAKAGDIQITTKSLSVSNFAQISAGTSGQGNAGNITINASDKVTFSDLGSANSTGVSDSVGDGGDIRIKAGDLLLKNGGSLLTFNGRAGNSGNIFLDVRDTITFEGVAINGIESGALTFAENGNAGNIEVKTSSLFLTDGSSMVSTLRREENSDNFSAGKIAINASDTIKIDGEFTGLRTELASGKGKGGEIEITTKSLSITNGGILYAITSGEGNAGNININASDTVTFDEGSLAFTSVNTNAIGNGGNIKIATGSLFITNDSQINASTSGKGNGGNIELNANDSVFLSNSGFINSNVGSGGEGKGGFINIDTQNLTLAGGSQIGAAVFRAEGNLPGGKGKGGEININASKSVNLSGISSTGFASGIFTSTGIGASGDAGNITVTTDNFRITDNAVVNATTFNDGNAGNITFNTNTFEAINGGQINSSTFNSGKAGNINLNIQDKIILSGNEQVPTGLFAGTAPESTGKGGSIFIDPRLVIIENGAGVSVGSDGSGDAGDISLQAGTLELNNGFIAAQTATTQGGDINLQISEKLVLRNNSQITTTAGTAQAGGDGGNININSKFIVAPQNENSDITANAFSGNGGKVNINSSGIFGIESQESLTGKSDITASSEEAISGETIINADDTSSIQNSFTELSPNIDTDAIIANSCIARGNKRQENSFKITGSGALPSNRPGNVLVSEYITGEVRNIDSENQVWKKGDRIIEPQGLYRLKNGELLLSRECSD